MRGRAGVAVMVTVPVPLGPALNTKPMLAPLSRLTLAALHVERDVVTVLVVEMPRLS